MKTFEGWYCAHCQRGVDASEVTFHEQHTVCGRTITDDVPPEPPVKESLTTEQPEDGPVAWMLTHKDGSTNFEDCHDAVLFMQKHFDVSASPLYPESVKAERDALREQLRQLEQRDFQELARANARVDRAINELRALREERRAVGERVKELEADAKRYRWLRNEAWAQYNAHKGKPEPLIVVAARDAVGNIKTILAEDGLDASVDTAMQEGKS